MTRLFFDTEFTDLKQDCELISIGVVADNGTPGDDRPAFYAESIDFGEDKCSEFVKDHILPNLVLKDVSPKVIKHNQSVAMSGTEEDIALQLDAWMRQFIEDGEQLEIWSDCLAYDWVLFRQLFESMGGVPSYVYYIPFDISTVMKVQGVDPDITREEFAAEKYSKDIKEIMGSDWGMKHNSLVDAMVIYYCYKRLYDLP